MGLEIIEVREVDWQLAFGHGAHAARWLAGGVQLVEDGERLAPESLPAEEPVAELVVDRLPADAVIGQPSGDPLLELLGGEAVELAGVNGDAVGRVDLAAGEDLLCFFPGDVVPRLDDGGDRKVVFDGELEVALVVGRHGHDGAGAVGGEHIVGDPDGDRLVVHRIEGVAAGEDAGLFLGQLGAVQLALGGGLVAVGSHRVSILRRGEALDKRMLGGDHHVGGAEQRVGPGGVNAQHLGTRRARPTRFLAVELPGVEQLADVVRAAGRLGDGFVRRADEEVDFGAGASADPVALESFNALGPVEARRGRAPGGRRRR